MFSFLMKEYTNCTTPITIKTTAITVTVVQDIWYSSALSPPATAACYATLPNSGIISFKREVPAIISKPNIISILPKTYTIFFISNTLSCFYNSKVSNLICSINMKFVAYEVKSLLITYGLTISNGKVTLQFPVISVSLVTKYPYASYSASSISDKS